MTQLNHRIFLAIITCLIFNSASSQYYISTVAGTGVDATRGDGGPAICAAVSGPTGICVDPPGNLYIVTSNSVRKVDALTKNITTIAGSDAWGYAGDGGPAVNAQMMMPFDICMDPIGNIYVSEYAGHRVRKISTDGIITTVAGTGEAGYSGDGGPASAAKLNTPHGISADWQSNLYITDAKNARIRKVDAETGMITTIIGNGAEAFSGDNGPATSATTAFPRSVAADEMGNIYFLESASGTSCRLRRIDGATGIVTTIAGSDACGYSGDGGLAINATLNNPVSVEIDIGHNIYVLEYDAPRLRKISSTTGLINTVAGNGANSFSGDGGAAVDASMHYPQGTALGFDEAIYVADVPNQRIRKLSLVAPAPQILSDVEVEMAPELPCAGAAVSFDAVVQNPGANQRYQWFVNNLPVDNHTGSFSSMELDEGDVVKCVYTSEHCIGTEVITSNEIAVRYGSGVAPTVSISSTDAKVCPGETITISASVQNGTGISYQWYRNDQPVGNGDAQFNYAPVDVDDFIRCDISSSGCAGGVTSSETVNVGVYQVPSVIVAPQEVNVPPGTVVQLSANVSGTLHNFSWISPEPLSNFNTLNAATGPVTNSHSIIFVGETADGCFVKDTVNIVVFIDLIMPNAFSPNRDGRNDEFRIPRGVKFSLREFSIFDRWGNKVFSTSDISRGWTGENARNGTYVYTVTGEIDGRKTMFKGTVLLSR